ncbi:MAG: hypothetical protein WCF85_10695 [Rhodospirillaceae bacterium]
MIPLVPEAPTGQHRNDRLIALFLFGLVAISPPILRVFGSSASLFGLPLLFVYIFAVWLLIVVLVALDIERTEKTEKLKETIPPP